MRMSGPVMMVYETPTFAVVGRRSLGHSPRIRMSLEARRSARRRRTVPLPSGRAFVDVTGLDTGDTITIESIGAFPVREPMLAQGDVDAVFGFAFSVVLNLKAQGVEEDDIVPGSSWPSMVSTSYGNAILVQHQTSAEGKTPRAVRGFLRALTKGFRDAAKTIPKPASTPCCNAPISSTAASRSSA